MGYQIPSSLSGLVKHGKKPGPKCYLKEEEKELPSFVNSCASIGKTGRGYCSVSYHRQGSFSRKENQSRHGGVVF